MLVELSDPVLGTLALGSDPYVVTGLQIGSPEVRAVTRNRALTSGTFDETRFLGPRAVTLSLRLKNNPKCNPIAESMTVLRERVAPYMTPNRRPFFSWQEPGTTLVRYMEVRGVSWPFGFTGPKYPTMELQWVCPSGEVWDGTAGTTGVCETIVPASDVELGRTYDEVYDRTYPASAPVGSRIINNPGTWFTHWTLTIYGATTNPKFTINGVLMNFNLNGGVNLLAGETLVIDSRSRTILLNGVATNSRYDRSNFSTWTWEQLMLQPGSNLVRFDALTLTPTSTAVLCYRAVYA